jgi:hypothetical protein
LLSGCNLGSHADQALLELLHLALQVREALNLRRGILCGLCCGLLSGQEALLNRGQLCLRLLPRLAGLGGLLLRGCDPGLEVGQRAGRACLLGELGADLSLIGLEHSDLASVVALVLGPVDEQQEGNQPTHHGQADEPERQRSCHVGAGVDGHGGPVQVGGS